MFISASCDLLWILIGYLFTLKDGFAYISRNVYPSISIVCEVKSIFSLYIQNMGSSCHTF